MKNIGNLRKMVAQLSEPIDYYLVLNEEHIHLNPLLNHKISLQFTSKINCVSCNRHIKKCFHQGFCYPCFKKLAMCDMCILKPELCHYHNGTCREPEWGKSNCFIPHIVYIANSSGIKVGISRESQIPTRWIDQGAIQALQIIRVQSRFQSGLIEKEIAKIIPDKTNWRKMLQANFDEADLLLVRDRIIEQVANAIQEISKQFDFGNIEILTNEKVVDIKYPVLKYPTKVKSLNFDKTPKITEVLQGIKGQYLIFNENVINIRKFSGYEVEFSS